MLKVFLYTQLVVLPLLSMCEKNLTTRSMYANIYLETRCHSQIQDTRMRVKRKHQATDSQPQHNVLLTVRINASFTNKPSKVKSNYVVVVQFNYLEWYLQELHTSS